MKIFVVLTENPSNVRKIAVNRLLISFLVPDLFRFKDLENDRKNDTKDCAVLDKINQRW